MKLCYAEGKDTMPNNDSLTQWTVAAGLAAMTAVLGFLVKWVFGKITDEVADGISALRIDMEKNAGAQAAGFARIEGEVRRLADTQQRQDTTIQLLRKDFDHLREAHSDLKQEFESFRSQQNGA